MTGSSLFLCLQDLQDGALRRSVRADLHELSGQQPDHMIQETIPVIVKNDRVFIRA